MDMTAADALKVRGTLEYELEAIQKMAQDPRISGDLVLKLRHISREIETRLLLLQQALEGLRMDLPIPEAYLPG